MKKIFFILFCFAFLSSPLFSQSFKKLESLADSLYGAEEYKKAILVYSKMLAMQPKNFKIYYSRGYSYLYSEKYQNAIADADKGLNLNPKLIYKYYFYRIKGYCFYFQNKYQKAIDFISKDLEMNYNEYYSYLLRGDSYYNLMKYDEAMLDFKYYLKNPTIEKENMLYVLSKTGFCYLDMDSILQAQGISDKLKSIDSTYDRSKILEGQLYYSKKKYDKALQLYTNAYNQDSTNVYVLEKMAYCNFNMKQYDTALKQFIKYNLKEPGYSETNNMISWTLFIKKKYNESIIYANKSILLDKLNSNAYDTRACSLYKTGHYSKAILDFNQSLKIDSTSSNSHYFRGLCYLKTNKLKDACNDWDFVLKDKKYAVVEGEESIMDLLNKNCR